MASDDRFKKVRQRGEISQIVVRSASVTERLEPALKKELLAAGSSDLDEGF
jgi:hypothetical protein